MPRETLIIRNVRMPIFTDLMSPRIIEVLRSGIYERREAAQLGAIIEPDEIILEVGAGLGFISTIAALNPNTQHVEIFEANPDLKPLIETVHRINQVHHVTVNTGVLMHQPTAATVPFYVCPDFWASSLSHHPASREVEVPAVDLNQTLQRIRPTMIICDIEGGELDLFAHAELDGVQKILMETHQEVFGRKNMKRLFDNLSDRGFHYDQRHSFGQVVLFSHVTRSTEVCRTPRGQSKVVRVTAAAAPDEHAPAIPYSKPRVAGWKKLLAPRPLPVRCHLHLGAHHTSAAFIRRAIGCGRESLAARGVVFWDSKSTRTNLTFPILDSGKKGRDPSNQASRSILQSALAAPEVANAARLVLSDENLMGRSPAVFRDGCYANVGKRMKLLDDALGGNVRAFLTIRNIADFFTAAYGETIIARGYQPFEDFLKNTGAMSFSWQDVWKELVEVFGREDLVVFDHESLMSRPAAVISRLVGTDFKLDAEEMPVNYQMSAAAVDYIRIERDWKSSRGPFEVAKAARARFPVTSGCAVFDPWTVAQRASLEANYQNDLRFLGLLSPVQ